MGLGLFHNNTLKEMKKTICSVILATFCSLGVKAQIADGYYHIKNAATGRYISINDTDPGNYKATQAGDVNMGGIRTYIDYDSVAVSPSCVIYIKNLGNGGYDLVSQGSSLYNMANQKLAINITSNGNGTYKIHGTAQGITKYLSDGSPSESDSWMMNRLTETQNWIPIPINTSNEYIAVRPDVKTADGQYFGTIRAGFSFRLASEGMAAFYISNAGGTGFTMDRVEGDVVPAGTPVIIRCNSANIKDNKIEPVIGGYTFDHDNWLGGVYCSISVSKHRNTTPYDQNTMRLLGLSDKGELAFVKNVPAERLYKEQYLMANKAYLKVNPGDADVMTHGGYTPDAISSVKTNDNATSIYTLTGVRLPDGVTPKAGIYIKNGKKIIIR
jgi:hypothetical protein